MKKLLIDFARAFWNDDVKARRWLRALFLAYATGGVAFADQVAEALGSPVRWVKVSALAAALIGAAINLGQKNPAPSPE